MRTTLSALVLLAVAACDRPHVLLICHNSNCAGADPQKDDSLEALDKSLALQVDGKPAFDGVEVDLFWRASDGQCIFAHDIEFNTDRTELSFEAADKVATYLTSAPELTYSGSNFQMFVELKDYVDADKTMLHTPDQLAAHAQCAWDFYNRIALAAQQRGVNVDFFWGSFGPELLKKVIELAPPTLPLPVRYESYYGVPKPLDPETRPLSDYKGVPISFVEMHSQWITDDAYEGLLAQKIDVAFFMFSATVEHFAAIEQYEPKMVNTSEAVLLRRWLER